MPNRLMRRTLYGAIVFAVSITTVACGNATDESPAAPQQAAPQATVPPPATATAVPQAAPTVAPMPTVAPSPEPTAVADTPTPVPENEDAVRLSGEGMELLTRFTEEYSPRQSGSDGELAAAEYIKAHLEDLGYDAVFQPVEVEHIPWGGEFVSLAGDGRPDLRAVPMSKTGFGDVSAPLVSVGRAFEDDIPEDGLDGVIALIERGEITFEEKVNRVADAGAVAAIIYNNERGNFRGALQSDGPIPAASLSQEEGEDVLQLLEDEPELVARVKIETVLLDSQNVIAELNDQPAECGVVVMGGHYDSVANTQAAGDNGTGVVSLLLMAEEVADEFADGNLPFAVRFVFFGVEEIGLYGSKHYVDELSEDEREEIIAMLNFDAMGKGNASVEGSAALVDRATRYAVDNGIRLNSRRISEGFGSDHASFLAVDIPALFFYGDDFSIINSPDDVLEEVDPFVMGANMTVGLGVLQEFECEPQG
ncbi:MAG: M28 family peptidase [Chloroflexi bacterium]|nr:M28 family peptidase [Chloroflexota bacterium]